MKSLAVGTIVAKNYLAFVRVVANSFRKFHPKIPFFVLLADEIEGYFNPDVEPFQLLLLNDLKIPQLTRFRFHHAQQELTYAATPYLLGYLLDQGFSQVAFMKQESLVLGNLDPIFAWMDQHSIVLTPHLLKPMTGKSPATRELNTLLAGVYNVGFLGISDSPLARQFVAWWQDRLYAHCRHAVSQGMHFEQRWLDLVPAYFKDVHILRDPAFNVGHWNLLERNVCLGPNGYQVEGQPCRFFRFSGFDPDRPQAVTRYSDRLTMANIGPVAALFRHYLTLLEEAGYHQTKTWPYAFGRFDNGIMVPDVARHLYRELEDKVEPFGDPLQTALPTSYFRWLNEPIDQGPAITHLWHAVYEQRPDVRQAFPDLLGADREAFRAWTQQSGMREHGFAESFLVPGKSSVLPLI